jgi:hypothetical protein
VVERMQVLVVALLVAEELERAIADNSSNSLPSRTSSQAKRMACARRSSSSPSSLFAIAAACFTQASAITRSG